MLAGRDAFTEAGERRVPLPKVQGHTFGTGHIKGSTKGHTLGRSHTQSRAHFWQFEDL